MLSELLHPNWIGMESVVWSGAAQTQHEKRKKSVWKSPNLFVVPKKILTASICYSMSVHEVHLLEAKNWINVKVNIAMQHGCMLCDEWTFFLVHERVNHLLQLKIIKNILLYKQYWWTASPSLAHRYTNIQFSVVSKTAYMLQCKLNEGSAQYSCPSRAYRWQDTVNIACTNESHIIS